MACAAERAGNGRATARSVARRAVPARPDNDELKMQAATIHKRPRKTAGTAYRGGSGLVFFRTGLRPHFPEKETKLSRSADLETDTRTSDRCRLFRKTDKGPRPPKSSA